MRRGEAKRIETLETQVADLAAQLAGAQKILALACVAITELDRTKQPVPGKQARFSVNTAEGVDIWSVS